MRLLLIKHQQVSNAKHQHKLVLRQFVSSSFASADFCLSARANLPVTPHLQQVNIAEGVYVRRSAYSGLSPLPRRAACGHVGERRAGTRSRFLESCRAEPRRGEASLRASVLPTRSPHTAKMSSPIKVEPEEAGLKRGG